MIEIFAFKRVYNSKIGKVKYGFFNRQRTSGILIELPKKSPICAQFINEHSGHYFGKHYHLLKELQVGIEDFDSKVYISSEQKALIDLLVTNSELREAICHSLDYQGELIIERNTIILKIFPDVTLANKIRKSKEALFELLEQKHKLLNRIAENWDFSGQVLDTKLERRIFLRGLFLNYITWFYFVFSIVAIVYTSEHRDLMLSSESWVYSLLFAGIFSSVLFWSSFKFLKASSWTFHYLIKRWLMQVLSTLLLSYSVIPFININYDNSLGKIVDGTLVTKRPPQGKARPCLIYKLDDDKNIHYQMYVDLDELNSHKIGEVRKFQLHSGHLGYKWGKFVSP